MQEKDTLFENWMDEYLSGSISDKDKASLFSLIQESERYTKEYNDRIKLYALLHVPAFEAQKEQKVISLKNKLEARSAHTGKTINWTFYIRSAAAVVLLMVIASWGTVTFYRHQILANDSARYYETVVPLGSQTKLILPDGSVAILNSGSILKYTLSFGKKERNVHLKGEGYFEVVKDPSKVFRVEVEDLKIEVTGTKFNVRSYLENHSVEVDLIEGGVDLITPDKHLSLLPDEKAIYNQTSGELDKVSVDAYKAALWTTGKLSFVNTSFAHILKDIERKYNVKIHIESELVQNEFFSGTINLNMPLENVFNFIDVDNKYVFERSGDVVILKNR